MEKRVKLHYNNDDMYAINFIETLIPELLKFGIHMELLDGGEGYEEVKIDSLEGLFYCGDDGSVGEELLAGVSDLEERCWVVEQSTKDGYLSMEEALKLYKVSEEDYKKFSEK